jgi:hypothetical protein
VDKKPTAKSSKHKKTLASKDTSVGGATGIRTLDRGLPYTHLAGVRLQPLGHRSTTHLSAWFGYEDLHQSSRGMLSLGENNDPKQNAPPKAMRPRPLTRIFPFNSRPWVKMATFRTRGIPPLKAAILLPRSNDSPPAPVFSFSYKKKTAREPRPLTSLFHRRHWAVSQRPPNLWPRSEQILDPSPGKGL